MINYIWPILMVIVSNVFYNITTKLTPEKANPFLVMIITYLVGAVLSVILFFNTKVEKNIMADFSKLNWTSILLGFSIVGLETGYIYMYRIGWNISIGSLIANIILSIILVFIGVLFYKEQINLNKIIGIGMCLVGLFFINKK